MNGMVNLGAADSLFPDNATDAMIGSIVRSMNNVVPARVVAYNRSTHIVQVEPLVRNFDVDKYVDSPLYICTVWRMYCGQYLIDVPIDIGDTGWLISADRDTTNVKDFCVHSVDGDLDEWKQQNPYTDGVKSFNFGFFIPDRWGGDYNRDAEHNAQLSVGEEDEGRLVIQSADGSQRVSIGQCDIKVWSTNTTINTTSDTIINSGASTTINAKADVNLNAEAGVSVKAKHVQVDSPAINFKTENLEVSGGIASKASASGTLSAGSVAQVKDGLIVSITNG